jgi:hypothetical protein
MYLCKAHTVGRQVAAFFMCRNNKPYFLSSVPSAYLGANDSRGKDNLSLICRPAVIVVASE